MPEELMRAFENALIFDRSTATVVSWARRGLLPGAVFIGNHVWFDRERIEDFIKAGGTPQRWPKSERFSVSRHGGRGHAGGKPRNDETRPTGDHGLARLVQPDPGVRDGAPDPTLDYNDVEPGRLLTAR